MSCIRHASDFDRAKLTDDNLRVLLLLQSFCYSSENDELKKIALRVVEKNPNASLKDITAELDAHMNVSTSLKMLENPVANPLTVTTNAVYAKYKKAQYSGFTKKSTTDKKTEVKCNGCGGAHQSAPSGTLCVITAREKAISPKCAGLNRRPQRTRRTRKPSRKMQVS